MADDPYVETCQDAITARIYLKCTLCNKPCDTYATMDVHKQCKAHLKKLEQKNLSISLNQSTSITGTNTTTESTSFGFFCQICNVACNTMDQLEKHNAGQKHERKAKMNQYKSFNEPNLSLSTEYKTISHTPMKSDEHKGPIKTTSNMTTPIVDMNDVETTLKSITISPLIRDLLQPVRTANEGITCKLCNVNVNTEEMYLAHCNGGKHTKRLKSYNVPLAIGINGSTRIDDTEFETCHVCDIRIHKNNRQSHNDGKAHKEKLVKSKSLETMDGIVVKKTNLSAELKNLELLKLKPRRYQVSLIVDN